MQVTCTLGDTIKIYNTTTLLATKTCATNPENISISVPEVNGVFSVAATLSDTAHIESAPSERITIFNDQTTRSAP